MKLENERYVATFTEQGGEITSFLDKQTGIQYMYQGDTPYWSGKNPMLFPMVGSTYTKDYVIDGKTYAMKNHGLIRYMTLAAVEGKDDEIVFALDSSEETRRQYPFDFRYEIHYTLEGNRLNIRYVITNTGEKEMPFSFGLHPGFLCPLCEGERFEDYKVTFDNPETLRQIIVDPQGKRPYEEEEVRLQHIDLDYALFEKHPTLIYKGMKSACATLSGPKGHGVRISLTGFPLFAIWTPKARAPFVCLEPWFGHGDFSPVEEDFYHREGTMILSGGKSFTCAYTIELL